MTHSLKQAFLLGTAAAACGLLVSGNPLTAQGKDYDVQLGPAQFTTVVVHESPPATEGLDIAPPPDVIYQGPPKVAPRVPEGKGGLPLPNTPQHTPQPVPPQGPGGPGDFRIWYNEVANPTGGSVSSGLAEPTAAIDRDTALYTGNNFAALSKDSGQSWTHVNPFTRFTAIDGGFCCDQRTLYVPGANAMMFWLLEYRYSSTTGIGSLRIAFNRNHDDLRNDTGWASFTLSSQTFGLGSGFFLDFSDLAYSNGYLYGSAIVGLPPQNSAANLVVWRAQLSDIYNGGNIGLQFYLRTTLGGFGNYRFAQGATSVMYFAAHESTSQLRVYRWDDSSNSATIHSRAVSGWSGTATPAPGPDGRDWTNFGYTVNTVLAGYARGGEIGFMWTSGAVSGRPQTFVRVAQFSQNSSVTSVGQFDLWNTTFAYHFPSCATNSLGHVGGTFAYGGGTLYPSVGAFIVDQYNSFTPAGWASYAVRGGAAGPSSNRWGDYFHASRNSNLSQTFCGTGFTRQTSTAVAECRYVWFGRDDYAPTWVNLNVQSTPISAVPIDVDVTDRFSQSNGNTSFSRSYPPSQGYALTAPASRVSGSTTYLFDHWQWIAQPGGTLFIEPVGQRVFDQSTIGSLDDTATAVYKAQRTLTVNSTNPSSGVAITVSPADVNGLGNGTTSFTRNYKDSEVVSLTAPASVGFNPFKQWRVGRSAFPLGQRTVTVTMSATNTAIADYYQNVAGSVTNLGAGCVGSNRVVPSHSIAWPSGQQGPQLGVFTDYNLTNARPNAGAALYIGVRKDLWGGLSLPLKLDFIGANGCILWHDIVIGVNLTTSATGAVRFRITWPNDPTAIGTHIYSSFGVIDPGAPRPLPLTMSNALDLMHGGNR